MIDLQESTRHKIIIILFFIKAKPNWQISMFI
ncbi:uncharacterized protein METZ01_LOCUS392444 [marine metagenome]|uniref:Uncharacterized protein n=1 Tax=marine metagenome TaxID=408172 RepID=A0A382UZG1_9ZZZZ